MSRDPKFFLCGVTLFLLGLALFSVGKTLIDYELIFNQLSDSTPTQQDLKELEDLDSWKYQRIKDDDALNFNKAILRYSLGETNKALEDLEALVGKQENPQLRSNIYYIIGKILLDEALRSRNPIKLGLAVGYFQKALEENPDNFDALYNLEKILKVLKEGSSIIPKDEEGDEFGEGSPEKDF